MFLTEMTGVDQQVAVQDKLAENAKRTYVTGEASAALINADPS